MKTHIFAGSLCAALSLGTAYAQIPTENAKIAPEIKATIERQQTQAEQFRRAALSTDQNTQILIEILNAQLEALRTLKSIEAKTK